jgi:hypothetical protein
MDAAKQDKAKRWLDFTVNVQSLVVSIVIAFATAAGIYFGLVGRVAALEARDIEHAGHFARLESQMQQQRQDVKDQLNAIGQNVEKIRDYLLDNAAGQRPDIKRWTR